MARWLTVPLFALCLLSAGLAAAAGVPIEKASKDQLKAAQRTFEAADLLYDAKRYQEAITAYRASYEIVASPNSRLQIARSLTALGKLDEAYAELLGAVADAKSAAAADEEKYGPTLKAAEAELAALEPRLGRVELVLGEALKGATITVGARTLGPGEADKPIVVTPGNVSIVAKAPDGRSAQREVAVAAGATEKVQLEPEPAPAASPAAAPAPAPAKGQAASFGADTAKPSSLRPIAYVAGGVGVAGLATFAVFGLMNKSKFDDLESSCTDGHCGPDRQNDIDSGKRYQTIANIGLAVGVVGLGAGTTLFLLSGSAKKSEKTTALRVRVAPGFASLDGHF